MRLFCRLFKRRRLARMGFKLYVHLLARQSMYVGCARLRDNSRARLPLLCTYRMHVCPHVRYVRIIPAQRRTAIFARLYMAIFAHPLETA